MINRKVKFLIVAILLITVCLWILAKQDLQIIIIQPLRSISQISALLGSVLFALESIIASRAKYLENLVGGLDKIYKLHLISGLTAVVALTIHPLFLILEALPNYTLANLYIIPDLSSPAYFTGIMALYSLLILIIFTLLLRLPYHIWKFTHSLMGLVVTFAVLHIFLIKSDTANYLPLRIWILGMMVVSWIAAFYKRFVYDKTASQNKYVIDHIDSDREHLDIYLKLAAGQKMDFKPGQFIFVQFLSQRVSHEPHPFTISSAPDDPYLRISIKPAGDFTYSLFALQKDTPVKVFGPYGHFANDFISSDEENLWIAGGIGVTPFLSLIRGYSQALKHKQVTLYYCTRNIAEARYISEINELITSQNLPINFVPYFSEQNGRISATKLLKSTQNHSKLKILMCGPVSMLDSLSSQFQELGIGRSRISFEEFNFKP